MSKLQNKENKVKQTENNWVLKNKEYLQKIKELAQNILVTEIRNTVIKY